MSTLYEKLEGIQAEMRAPKNKTNTFGKYQYRNAEGILAAFKGLGIGGAVLTCTDTLQEVAGQIFVTAEAKLTIGGESVSCFGHAMHALQKKGADAAQITGMASSYARKYALNGLFIIEDESQDPDSIDQRQENGQTPPPPKLVTQEQDAILTGLSRAAGTDVSAVLGKYGIEGNNWSLLPVECFEQCRKGMQAKIDKMEQEKEQ